MTLMVNGMVKKILLIVSFFVFFVKSDAQVDTSFWFVAPDISATMGDSPVQLHIQTYSQAATVYVRQPANIATGVNLTLSVPANTLNISNLTPSLTALESAPTNSVSNKGIYISSNAKISVYYTIGAGTNKEMISLKGQRAKGFDFYTPFPNSVLSTTIAGGEPGFDVVATNTGVTTILITPRAACVGRAKNVTFARTLNQGETFSMRDNLAVNPSELAGSIISADKPIAVTISGSIRTSTVLCPSYFTDQITTSDRIDKYLPLKKIIFLPILFVLVQSKLRVGEWLQPRYILPIFYVIVGLSLIVIFKSINVASLGVVVNILSLFSSLSFIFGLHTLYRRYTVGLDQFNLFFHDNNSWWWNQSLYTRPVLFYLIAVTAYLIFWVLIRKEVLSNEMIRSKSNSY